jgi:hypothetical protein
MPVHPPNARRGIEVTVQTNSFPLCLSTTDDKIVISPDADDDDAEAVPLDGFVI